MSEDNQRFLILAIGAILMMACYTAGEVLTKKCQRPCCSEVSK